MFTQTCRWIRRAVYILGPFVCWFVALHTSYEICMPREKTTAERCRTDSRQSIMENVKCELAIFRAPSIAFSLSLSHFLAEHMSPRGASNAIFMLLPQTQCHEYGRVPNSSYTSVRWSVAFRVTANYIE